MEIPTQQIIVTSANYVDILYFLLLMLAYSLLCSERTICTLHLLEQTLKFIFHSSFISVIFFFLKKINLQTRLFLSHSKTTAKQSNEPKKKKKKNYRNYNKREFSETINIFRQCALHVTFNEMLTQIHLSVENDIFES